VVAKTEQRHYLLLSTLKAYFEAIGGHLRIVVSFEGGGEVGLDLRQLDPTAPKGATDARLSPPPHPCGGDPHCQMPAQSRRSMRLGLRACVDPAGQFGDCLECG